MPTFRGGKNVIKLQMNGPLKANARDVVPVKE